jgi:hypothetical protein
MIFYGSDVEPQSLWEREDRVFLKPHSNRWAQYPMPLVARFVAGIGGVTVRLVLVCSTTTDNELKATLLIDDEKTASAINWLFDALSKTPQSTRLGELQDRLPSFAAMDHRVEIIHHDGLHGQWATTVSASFKVGCLCGAGSDTMRVDIRAEKTATDSLNTGYGVAY